MVNLVKVKLLKDFPREGWKKGEIQNWKREEAIIWERENVIEIIEDKKAKKKQIKKLKTTKKKKQTKKQKIKKRPVIKEEKSKPLEIDVKEILLREKERQELINFKENEINWLEDDYWDSWDKIKGHVKKLLDNGEPYIKNEPIKWFFLSHDKDTIKGKPQLVENVKKKILLMRMAIKKDKNPETNEEYNKKQIFFFDEDFDKRHDGFQRDSFALDFWLYKVISEDFKEYYILSNEKLPNCVCTFKGMSIEVNDFAEMSRSMKIKSLSRLFVLKEFEPDVKILTKEQLITYTKERNINEEDWLSFLAYHKFETLNRFPYEMEMLKSAFILSGKTEEWPLNLAIVGPTGTRKTMGHIETTAYKFSEDTLICEGANSRIKGLSPSFKEKPADQGFLAKSDRVGFIDEIGKMIEFESNKHQSNIQHILGELNFLLEHKKRTVNSGNDNGCEVQASAKFMFVTNPVSDKHNIYQHVGLIDPTMMSRIFWWVQDDEEQSFVLGKDGIVKIPPTPTQAQANSKDLINRVENRKIDQKCRRMLGGLLRCWGKISSRDEFLTLFDTCYSFICEINDEEVDRLVNISVLLAKEPMKTSVWKPRAAHHVKLLIDGLCKHRCLFKDYDPTFTPKQEDYDLAERILIRMVKSWDTNLSPKEHQNYSGGFV